ncbi:MAG: elongation factor Ts [Patescibacteria group bacterium]|nr:elongation factor Ts [Patescibacteria group bacterium]
MIKIEEVKKLREETGVSIMECKKALEKSGGDIKQAKKILREKGEEVAGKRSGRSTEEGLITTYVHPNRKIGVILDIRSESDFVAKSDDFKELAHEICLQIAALNPSYVMEDEIPEEVIKEEKEIAMKQFEGSNKPKEVIEKIIEGKVKKFKKETVLINQVWVKDGEKKIEDLINEKVAKLGEKIVVNRFKRFEI